MVSIERTKKLLNNPKLTDAEVEKIRDIFHALSEIIFERWIIEKNKKIESSDLNLKK